jgi:D-alanyl-D-alanine carboxypeptidase
MMQEKKDCLLLSVPLIGLWKSKKTLFENKIGKYLSNGLSNQEATVEAAKWIAVPGTSEHQTGLAVDIVAKSYQMLDKEQENTPEQKWLMENSYKYGFILRYPENKSDITGISYEPWHYRYVGKEAAKEIYENGICLEEYLEQSL